MSVWGKLRSISQNPASVGSHLRSTSTSVLSGVEAAAFSRVPVGDNVLDEEWDLLVVLDTCRRDALGAARATGQYPWLSDARVESRFSLGGSTVEWTAQTFRESYRERVARVDYLAGNALVEQVLAGQRAPETVDGAGWSPTAWDILTSSAFNEFVSAADLRNARGPDAGHGDRPHPSAALVTDLAIRHGRHQRPERLIVHYIQPHYPYYSAIESGERTELFDWETYPFPSLMAGELSRQTVWNRYMAELRSGLTGVTTLLENYDADRAVVTADHGEAFGERFLGVRGYKHRVGTLHPKVRRVPWVRTSAVDRRTRHPDAEVATVRTSPTDQLAALGYVQS